MSWGRTHSWLLVGLLSACQSPDSVPDETDAGSSLAILDDCPGDHVAIPGGGCKRVGVALCADGKGIEGPPEWSCKRVGVDECTIEGGPGLAGPPDWTCKAIGPSRRCKPGWAKQNGNWWCEPILPKAKCPVGTMEVIGKTTCQPVGHCVTPSMTSPSLFVDQSYTGTDADGSKAKPYPQIGQALAAAKAGDTIEVAKGSYNENLVLDKQVELRARCGDLVTIVGQSKAKASVYIDADGVSLSRLAITGPREGIVVHKAKVALRQILVSETTGDGVTIYGGEVAFDRCTIRDIKKTPYDAAGIRTVAINKASSVVEVEDSVVLRAWDTGILADHADATVTGSVVKDTRAEPLLEDTSNRLFRHVPEWMRAGIYAFGPSSLKVTDCLVAGNHMTGIMGEDAHMVVEQTVVRDTVHVPGLFWGGGVLVGDSGAGWSLNIKDSLVRNNHQYNVVYGGTGTVERTVIGPGRANPLIGRGIGVFVPSVSEITVRDCLVADHFSAGVEAWSAVAVHGSVIRDTKPVSLPPTKYMRNTVGLYGNGIQAWGRLTVTGSTITTNTYAGIRLSGEALSVTDSRIQGTRPGLDYQGGLPLAFGIELFTNRSNKPATLAVRDTVISRNQGQGLSVYGVAAEIDRVVVSDNSNNAPEGSQQPSMGIRAQPWALGVEPPELTIRDTLVDRAGYLGIGAFAVPTRVERTIVRDTQLEWFPLELNYGNQLGAAVFSGTPDLPGWRWPWDRASLVLEDSVLERSHLMSLALWSTVATVSGCRIEDTRAIPASPTPRWGDAVAGIGGTKGPTELHIKDTQVLGSDRAGLFMSGGKGSVRGSMFARGALTIALEDAADIEFPEPDDNRYVDNLDNKLSFEQGLKPPPMPMLPPPPGAK